MKPLGCPKCGSEEILQYGEVSATWGGQGVVDDAGEREWLDDGNGANVAWDVFGIKAYGCSVCGWMSKADDLNELAVVDTVEVVYEVTVHVPADAEIPEEHDIQRAVGAIEFVQSVSVSRF